ncbi:MAG: hypothetical protein INH41_25805 [Myxococcaceae bacterium]|jgi:hypothetical protein|nr:hypothetical protein [Myxococcaceae bacterium]MCA3015817.1 hypothetical protein [Myxococcaceae bacterium]
MSVRAARLLALFALSAWGETQEQCLALCLDGAKQLERDCLRQAKQPEATRKRECAEARKTLETFCPAACSGTQPKDVRHGD